MFRRRLLRLSDWYQFFETECSAVSKRSSRLTDQYEVSMCAGLIFCWSKLRRKSAVLLSTTTCEKPACPDRQSRAAIQPSRYSPLLFIFSGVICDRTKIRFFPVISSGFFPVPGARFGQPLGRRSQAACSCSRVPTGRKRSGTPRMCSGMCGKPLSAAHRATALPAPP